MKKIMYIFLLALILVGCSNPYAEQIKSSETKVVIPKITLVKGEKESQTEIIHFENKSNSVKSYAFYVVGYSDNHEEGMMAFEAKFIDDLHDGNSIDGIYWTCNPLKLVENVHIPPNTTVDYEYEFFLDDENKDKLKDGEEITLELKCDLFANIKDGKVD